MLSVMGKPRREVYDAFVERFERLSASYGLKQYVVPYLISSHPGSTMKEAVELAEAVRDMGYMPEQVQDFYPTPSTMSTCMFYTGVDPRTMKPVYVARDPHEKAMQRALIQYRKPENHKLVKEALRRAGREDLIGYGPSASSAPCRPSRARAAERRAARQVTTSRTRPARCPPEAASQAKAASRGARTAAQRPKRASVARHPSAASPPPRESPSAHPSSEARPTRQPMPTPATAPPRGAKARTGINADP